MNLSRSATQKIEPLRPHQCLAPKSCNRFAHDSGRHMLILPQGKKDIHRMPDHPGFLIQPLSARGTCPACTSERWTCSITYWVCWDCGHQHHPELTDLRSREQLEPHIASFSDVKD